ncbi:MAG: GAF domain-containing protein [Candidatus Omnitrophota bacterium]|jgi:GGDEF domain-containing protein
MTLKTKIGSFAARIQWLIEMLFLFFVAHALNLLFYPSDIGFIYVPLHPYWIIVLLAASKYGFTAGSMSGLAACLLVIYFRHGGIPHRLELEAMAEQGGLLLPLAFLSVGVFLGGVREKQIRKHKALEETCEERQKENTRLDELFQATEKARLILETQIVNQSTTIRMLYEEVRKLEAVNREAVYRGCLDILAEHFQVQKASIYLKEGDDFVLKMSRGWDAAEAVEGKVPCEGSVMSLACDGSKTVTVQDLIRRKDAARYEAQYGKFLAMIPLACEGGPVVGVVNVEKIDFLAFNRANLELIEMVVRWTARAVANIDTMESLRRSNLFDPLEGVYTYCHFENVLASEFERARLGGAAPTVAILKLSGFGFLNPVQQEIFKKAFLANLKRLFAGVDSVFNYRYGGTYALVAPLRSEREVAALLGDLGTEMRKIKQEFAWGAAQWNRGMKDARELAEPALKACGMGAS